MAGELQHCPECQEEYVAGVTACVECGGALHPGPLERLPKSARRADAARPVPEDGTEQSYRLLARMPGVQADHAVRTLLLEEITCRVECQGIVKTYAPGAPPAEPFAVTLPVSVYVMDAQHDSAQEILSSLSSDDVIGDQWSAVEDADADSAIGEDEPLADADAEPAADDPPAGEPVAESTSLRTVLLIVVAAIVLLFLFGRS